MLAETSAKYGTIKKVITNGGNVNIVNNRNDTPLHYVVKRGNILNEYTLFKRNADITMVIDTGKNELQPAEISNIHVLLQRLISQAIDMNLIQCIVNMYDSDGDTALTIAIKSKHIHTGELVLANNANIYDRYYQYMTLFMLSYCVKSLKMMKLLHAKDKDLVNNADVKGYSSLMDSCNHEKL